MTPAHVSREVNYLYFIVVLAITLTVLSVALYTRNKRAIRIFFLAMVIWAIIEGIGIVSGMRVYEPVSDRMIIFVFVSLLEDPGWCCLGFMAAEQLFKRVSLKSTNIK